MSIQDKMQLAIFAFGLVIGLTVGLALGISLPHYWQVSTGSPAVSATATPDNCFKTANYSNGQIVSYGHRCVPVTP